MRDRKERFVQVGSLVQKSLWKYINGYRPQPITEKVTRLFLIKYGIPLTKSGVQQMVRRSGIQAGITGTRCSPHTFRHIFDNHIKKGYNQAQCARLHKTVWCRFEFSYYITDA